MERKTQRLERERVLLKVAFHFILQFFFKFKSNSTIKLNCHPSMSSICVLIVCLRTTPLKSAAELLT
ncbi:hypothetical protein LguiB_035720 [Lonicera macranthoides]